MTRAVILIAALLGAWALQAAPDHSTWSAWTDVTATAAGTFTGAADWQAPTASAAAVGKSAGASTGYIRQGGGYYLYANVTDAGNPASGTSTVSANVSSITSGQTAVALSAGSFTAQGVAYNRRSALLTANASLAAGTLATTLAATDLAANSAVAAGPAVTVDNTAPAGNSVQTANGGLVAGRPDAGDTITLGWSEMIDPHSILPSWPGTETAVQVYIYESSDEDILVVRTTAGVVLALGYLELDGDYVSSNATFTATMTQTAATISIRLGALVGGSPRTDTSKSRLIWNTVLTAGATDRAGNAVVSSDLDETGRSDHDF